MEFCLFLWYNINEEVSTMLSDSQRRNYDYFSNHLSEWLADNLKVNKFAVIYNEGLVGLYDSFEAAFRFAYTQFSDTDFIIQQIVDQSEIVEFLRSAVI